MAAFQHYLNSLHVFCRLVSLGMSRRKALRVARFWERCVHPFLYKTLYKTL